MTHVVTALPGDGIGPEIMIATMRVINATGVDIEWDIRLIGEAALEVHKSNFPLSTTRSIRTNKVAIKGPTNTPSGKGHRSLNVRLREEFGLFANVRPALAMPGVRTRWSDVPVDLVVFRENLEDLYVGDEKLIEGGAESVARFTHKGCERIARYAFEYAKRNGRRKVTVVSKPNILKLTHGLFLNTALDVSKEYPEIECDSMIMDAFQAKLVVRPELFDCMLFPNLFGDLASDLCAALVGGLGFAPGANIGDDCAIFEAVHGTAPDIAGKNIANPTSLILSGAMMLDHLGEHTASESIRHALEAIYTEGVSVTGDVNREHPVSTDEFSYAVMKKL